ncbi:MAG: TlpA family protein disulfide reductase [Chloroflexi bacterium]|nr:MAG: TlpA family protein disulfide reductase [Chloroflexota bacterium]
MLETGALAPHFTLLGVDGKEYSLPKDAGGEPTLLVFFKTTCGTCDTAFPYVNRLRETYPEGWRLWAIAQNSPREAAQYARSQGITYPVLIDAPDYSVSRLYDPAATPSLFLNNAIGRTVFATHGFAKDDMNELAVLVAQLVGAEPVIIAPENDGRPSFKPG